MWCYLLFISLFVTTCCELEAENGVDIYPVNNTESIVTAPGNFEFICNTTIDFDLTLVIDDSVNTTNATKFDRIHITDMTTAEETVYQYTFMDTISTDNGTTFSCIAINSTNGTPFQSDNLTLQVYYPPVFFHNNGTVLRELRQGEDHSLYCNISSANPTPHLKLIIDAKHKTNVDFMVEGEQNETGIIHFSNASVNNSGGYTCNATNIAGSSELSYYIYIGGPPDKVNASVDIKVIDDKVNFSITVFDNSSAPAKEILVYLKGTTDKNITLNLSQPLINGSKYTFTNFLTESVDHLGTTDHVLKVYAKNTLGDVHVKDVTFAVGGPYFIEGTNTSILSEIRTGSNVSLKCTVRYSLPPVTKLEIFPPNESESNWIIKKNGTHSIEMVITNATSKMNKMDITCSAENGIGTALLVYHNFVGGPPDKVNASVDINVIDDKVNFSITVSDNSSAPAKDILVYLKGTTKHNITLRLPLPQPLINGSNHTFNNFLTESVDHLGTTNHVLNVYAKNTLGDVHVKDVTFAVGELHFSEGTNTSIWSEIRTGSNVSLNCTVRDSLPPVTELEMFPPAKNESNWIIKRNGTHSIEMVITNATSKMNTRDIMCSAGNGIGTAQLVYHNFVGGPPDKVSASVYLKVIDDKANFSITVSDNSSAPAKEILVYLKGTTKHNITLPLPQPLINGSHYTFTNFLTESVDHLGTTEHVLKVYAKNTLGDVYVRNFTFTIPKAEKGVDIYPVNDSTIVTAPDNFEFICNTTIEFNLILLIDRITNSTKFDRIHIKNMTTAKETVFQYTFMNTVSTDNGTTFKCIANTNGTRLESDILTLQVNSKKKSSNAGKIAAGVVVPVAVIIIAIIAGAAIFCFWKKKKRTRRGFVALQNNGDFDDASKGYGTST